MHCLVSPLEIHCRWFQGIIKYFIMGNTSMGGKSLFSDLNKLLINGLRDHYSFLNEESLL